MLNEFDFEDGGEMEGTQKIKKSLYQVIPADMLDGYQHARPAMSWGRRKMRNPEYYRLIDKNGNFVGFKRIVTEYLPAAATRWQLDPVDHDSDATQKLSKPAMGTATLGREQIVTAKKTQIRVTHPRSKDHNEPAPVPSRGGLSLMADGDFPPMPEVKPPKEDDD